MRRLVAAVALAASAVAMAVPPTARQAAEDEALVRKLVATRLVPLVVEWRDRAAGDAALRERLDLALLEIRVADDSPAARLAEVVPARRALVERAVAAGDPRRAAWSLDLASDLLVAWPAIDGRVATLAVGIATPEAAGEWRRSLDDADAALAAARAAIAEVPRGPLALPDARDFRRGWDGRLAALEAIAAGTRALLDGRTPEAIAVEVPAGAEWNDLALLAALAGGPDGLRSLAGDASRGAWITLAAECGGDLAAFGDRARQRLPGRAAELARGRSPALALLAADAAVRAAAPDDPARFEAWSTLLDATPAARRGAVRAEVFPRLQSLPPTGEPAAMGDLELAVRSLVEPMPEGIAEAIDARTPSLDGSPAEPSRLLAFARLRLLASRGPLVEAAALAERLATSLADDPIAAAAVDTLVLARTALASASTDEASARAEREALTLATERFPRHPRHDRWAIDLALARLDAGETAAAVEACRLVPDGAPLAAEARAVEAIALVRAGDPASIARAEAIVRDSAGTDAEVAARLAIANALLLGRAGRVDEARATADATVADPSLPMHVRADAMRIALELGATPPAHAASGIVAAIPRSRAPLVAALREAAAATTIDRERLRTLLAPLAGATASLTPDERLAVADATLAAGDANGAARLASETLAAATRGSGTALAATLVRARALRALGGDANLSEAFALGRDVVRISPQSSPAWWDANALQLEILEASGRNRDQIVPWVNRLRAIDPQLGGRATRTRIEAVALQADS